MQTNDEYLEKEKNLKKTNGEPKLACRTPKPNRKHTLNQTTSQQYKYKNAISRNNYQDKNDNKKDKHCNRPNTPAHPNYLKHNKNTKEDQETLET